LPEELFDLEYGKVKKMPNKKPRNIDGLMKAAELLKD
jgi:hypothetical protein